MLAPTADDFVRLAKDHDFVPVYRRLLSDTLTPVTAFRLLDDGGPACLFESVIGGEKVGRYSFLAAHPVRRFAAKGQQIEVTEYANCEMPAEPLTSQSAKSPATSPPTTNPQSPNSSEPRFQAIERTEAEDPLDHFRSHFDCRVAQLEGLPPFIGGAIGYAGYDVVRYVENLPHPPADDRDLPDLDFAFYHTLCVFDHVDKTITVVSLADCREASVDCGGASRELAVREAYRQAGARVEATIDALSQDLALRPEELPAASQRVPLDVQSNFTPESFRDAVRKCVEYIRAGDIFQVVPSQRLSVETDVDPLEIYRSLRVVNPSPFMFFLRTPECVLVGCSPEIMCRVTDRVVTVRPLAGTRPRGRTEREDRELERELLADPKERAEHVMLVDLGRNDVGRIARFGSIELTEVMVVERYSHVMHISSEVQGVLREGLDAFDALKACVPAGTVSGAPKVRAMQIIDSIEPHRRGPYAGAVGYIDYRGNMDTCIALRTMVIRHGKVYVQAGCGVVADSDPEAEYQETLNKAKALIAAIELTVARLEKRASP